MKNLKKFIIAVVLASISTLASPAPDSKDQPPATKNNRPENNGFLFSVKKENKSFFLLGTIHAGISEKQIIGENILKAAAMSSKILVEANIFNKTDMRNSMVFFGTDKSRKNLRETIGDKYYYFFKIMFVENYKILKQEEFDNAKPWFLAMLIPIADASKEVYLRSEYGTESQLFYFSSDHGIPIGELEGLDSQLKILDSMNKRDEGPYFNSYVNLIQERALYHWQLKEIASWTNQNIEGIQEVLKSMDARGSTYTNFYLSKMIKSRNNSLAARIIDIAATEDRCLFAIGSEHLTGASNVLEQLRAAGFVITPMQ